MKCLFISKRRLSTREFSSDCLELISVIFPSHCLVSCVMRKMTEKITSTERAHGSSKRNKTGTSLRDFQNKEISSDVIFDWCLICNIKDQHLPFLCRMPKKTSFLLKMPLNKIQNHMVSLM